MIRAPPWLPEKINYFSGGKYEVYLYIRRKKFKEEKEKENEILRAFGIDEETIEKIYEYDKKMFNKNRAFCTNEVYL